MKTLLALVLGLVFMLCLPSCATHNCPSDCKLPPECSLTKTSFQAKRSKRNYDVYSTKSSGAPMLILHELGGLNPCTLDFGVKEAAKRWKVYMPALDSDYGMCDVIKHSQRMKKSNIWDARNPDHSGPIFGDLEDMVDWISSLHHGQRVVVMGNCLTGGMPLGLIARPSVKTAVMCQPAIPLKGLSNMYLGVPESAAHKKGLGLSDAQLDATVKAVKSDPSKQVIGFHYLNDPLASFEKFERIHRLLGPRFHAVVLVPPGMASESTWYQQRASIAPTGRLAPHSTVTGAENGINVPQCDDRTWLQQQFNKLIVP